MAADTHQEDVAWRGGENPREPRLTLAFSILQTPWLDYLQPLDLLIHEKGDDNNHIFLPGIVSRRIRDGTCRQPSVAHNQCLICNIVTHCGMLGPWWLRTVTVRSDSVSDPTILGSGPP